MFQPLTPMVLCSLDIFFPVLLCIFKYDMNRNHFLFYRFPLKRNVDIMTHVLLNLRWISTSGTYISQTQHSDIINNIEYCNINVIWLHMSFRTPTLMVAEDNYFNVSVKLSNHGDDSYNTSLTMHYPPGLSFSMMSLTEVNILLLYNIYTQWPFYYVYLYTCW